MGYWYGYDPVEQANGNTMLIKITNYRYIFVGWCIYQFDTDEELIDYVSPLGNNDVPYPIAYGINYVYFMLDRQKAKRTDVKYSHISAAESLYAEFYGHIGNNNFTKTKFKIVQLHDGL